MARYKYSYNGERRIVKRSTKFTPSEAASLDKEAARQMVNWSDFSRQTLLCWIGKPVITDKWDPRLVQAFTAAGRAHNAVGNLLNQIAPYIHTAGDLGPFGADLREALARHREVSAMHKAALMRFSAF